MPQLHPLILRRTIRPLDPFRPQSCVFGSTASHALAPHPERAGFQVSTHEINHCGLIEPKSSLYRLKRRSVLPRHLNDARDIASIEAQFAAKQYIKPPPPVALSEAMSQPRVPCDATHDFDGAVSFKPMRSW